MMDRPDLFSSPHAHLATLANLLSDHQLTTELSRVALVVRNPEAPACCDSAGRVRADSITCRPRAEKGGVLWFYTSWQEPIAPVGRLKDAADRIVRYLARPS